MGSEEACNSESMIWGELRDSRRCIVDRLYLHPAWGQKTYTSKLFALLNQQFSGMSGNRLDAGSSPVFH